VERKLNLSYIINDEQNKEKRLAQTPENGKEAQGTEKGAGQDCKIERSIPLSHTNAGG
jgi:hypothetical protein